MEYKVAIPSYKRHTTIKEKTLKYLNECGIQENKIYIFCANEAETEIYKSHVGGQYNYITGVETLMAQRNFIQGYFSEGELIINIDDDVEGLFEKNGAKLIPFTNLDQLAEQGYNEMKKCNAKIFGVYPVANGFFMKDRVTTELKYIVGCFWGCIIDHSKDLNVELEDKEDFERSIRYFKKHGAVVRIENISVLTRYYKEAGGMQVTRTKQRVHDSAMFLIEKYPEYCEINTAKKNKEFVEVKLRYEPKPDVIQTQLF